MVEISTVEPSAEECIQQEKTVIGALAGAFERTLDDFISLLIVATGGYMAAMGMVVPDWMISLMGAVVTYHVLKIKQ